MDYTLTLDDEAVERLRDLAAKRQTTLEVLLVERLRQVAATALADEWERFTKEHAGRSEPGWRFNREELYDRPVLRRDYGRSPAARNADDSHPDLG